MQSRTINALSMHLYKYAYGLIRRIIIIVIIAVHCAFEQFTFEKVLEFHVFVQSVQSALVFQYSLEIQRSQNADWRE
jgi:hypothetical protein